KPPVCGGRGELVGDLETVWRAKLLDCHYLTPIPSTTHPGDEWRDDSLVQSSIHAARALTVYSVVCGLQFCLFFALLCAYIRYHYG
ncbi:hypothetical protein J6590_107740, partial [Homalodisca vitripennis]